jgi:TonB family protein
MNFEKEKSEIELLPICTLVLWLGGVTVGAAGLIFHYPRPLSTAKNLEPIHAEVMHVELSNDTSPPPDIGPPAADDAAPAPQQIEAPTAPQLITVAQASPSIAFAVPTTSPAHVIETKQVNTPSSAPIVTAAQHLTFGQGEGRQPAPEYPREAALAHQQGTVVVRFTVNEEGWVRTAQAITPCPFPLLNQAAVRAVRETWRFRAGPIRSYEVSIEFQLKQH